MARARKPRPLPLAQVEPGVVFALPLEDGRWGACRVLRKADDSSRVLVLSCAWVGDAPPADLSAPGLTTPLVLTHHSWKGARNLCWVDEPVPPDAVRLGNLPPTADD